MSRKFLISLGDEACTYLSQSIGNKTIPELIQELIVVHIINTSNIDNPKNVDDTAMGTNKTYKI